MPTTTAVSIPALAVALCAWQKGAPVAPVATALQPRMLAPMYRLVAGSVAAEVQAAVQLVNTVADRLRRLKRAYGEWRTFEPGPYFDLTPAQVTLLTRVTERVATVHVVFYVDALLPAFQETQAYAARFVPHFGSVEHSDMVITTLASQWRRMLAVVEGVHHDLRHDIDFLALNAAAEEQERWTAARRQSGSSNDPPWCEAAGQRLPSLTLSIEFPLPAFRQPGRKRRLQRTWQRRFGFSANIDADA
ncbi:MAG TPA: hypothetical protein GYA08_06980 [Chloroflexi bacterium]|nr:hypothetical protein [Chloroflexota bacterium]